MINLKPYSGDCFAFHSEVISNKYHTQNDPTYKDRIMALDGQIEELFRQYPDLTSENDLLSHSPYGFEGQQKTDLLSLYRYKSKVLQELLILLTTKKKRKFNTCQMCTVDPIGSFDHIIPKGEFPEYAVNPINLFPSCLTCNDQKGSRWIEDGKRTFLNLYNNILPETEYLKIEFSPYPIPNFSIEESTLNPNFFSLVNSHYLKLNLFTRFRENSNEIIDPIITDAKRIVPKMGIKVFRSIVEESTTEMRSMYGFNHWKSLLKLAVVNHDDFESFLT